MTAVQWGSPVRLETLEHFSGHPCIGFDGQYRVGADFHGTAHRIDYHNGSCLILIGYQPSTGRVRIRCPDTGPNLLAAISAQRQIGDWIAGLPPVAPIVEIPA